MLTSAAGLLQSPAMFVRVKSTPYSPRKSVQIVASQRIGDKIKQVILRHVGVADDEQELLRLKELAEVLLHQIRQQESPELFLPNQLLPSRNPPQRSSLDKPAGGRPSPAASVPLEVDLRHLREQSRNITGIHEIYGPLYEELGFGRVLATPSAHGGAVRLLKQMVLARLAAPPEQARLGARPGRPLRDQAFAAGGIPHARSRG